MEDRLHTDAELAAALRSAADRRGAHMRAADKLLMQEAADVADQLTKLRDAARQALAVLDPELIAGSKTLQDLEKAVEYAADRVRRPM